MPHNSRTAMREQAKTIRELGETVWLLTSTNNEGQTTDTPFSATLADIPQDQDDESFAIYAYVQWGADDMVYDAGGRAQNMSAIVTANAQYLPLMKACYAVKFSNGAILRKVDEMLSDERTSYAIKCEGVVETPQV